MKWNISKDGVSYCTTTVPYQKETIKAMKEAGYKIKEVKDVKDNEKS